MSSRTNNKSEFFCPTCKEYRFLIKVGCGCSKDKKYFCEKCRVTYPEHRLTIKPASE